MDSEKAHKRALLGLRFVSFTVLGRMLLRVLYKPRKLNSKQLVLNLITLLAWLLEWIKEAEAMTGWENLGFGFIEIGGITEHEQSGNPKPRMFRSSKHRALVNRMGFNNPGSDKMAEHLSKTRKPGFQFFSTWVSLRSQASKMHT